jgi:outer membrane protein assembly factor BamB
MLVLAGCAGPAANPPATVTPPEPGTVLWTFETGAAVWSSPTVDEGVVYFGSDDASLYAVDLTAGELRWKFPTGGSVRSRPEVADGIVYASSDDGFLYAVEAASGTLSWRADLGAADMPERGALGSAWDYQLSSPVVAEGAVYVGSGANAVYAFDAVSGEQLWRYPTASRVRSSPAVAEGVVYIGDGVSTLHAIEAASGARLWTAEGCSISTPLVVDGAVYCGSRGFVEVRAWDAATGELLWQFSVGHSWVDSSPRIVDGTLYIGSSDAASLFALDPVTGARKWRAQLTGYAWSSPAVSQGVAYIGTFMPGIPGKLYAVGASDGAILWSLPIDEGVVSSPVVVGGVIYFGGIDGKLYAVKA